MRKMLGVAVITLALGACTTLPNGQVTINQQELASVEAQIQQAVATACKFVPTVASVASVISTFVAAGAVIDLINAATSSICSAVVTAPTAQAAIGNRMVQRLAAPVNVNGAPINGYFIK